MMRRITEIWPTLLRRGGQDIGEERHAEESDEQGLLSQDQSQERADEEILEYFKNLYWTRLMQIDGYENG